MAWQKLCPLDEIPALGARVVEHAEGAIAVFRTAGDSVFALADACPHKGGPLSQGIVHGEGETARVTCPLHNWNIALASGSACAPDEGCSRRYATRIDAGVVWLEL
ncbi:MAG: nitrite reductase small subunit NirD [Zoogloeaceae bacterium]|nr:nitrite reductase small subunit NirD [Zoogloeaceae bacterium]